MSPACSASPGARRGAAAPLPDWGPNAAPALFAVLILCGCAGGGAAGPSSPAADPDLAEPVSPGPVHSSFERRIDPFPVFDEHGEPYEHPFLGGLIVPRVQFVDMTGNGAPDLFLQERSNEIIFFENVGSATEPRFEWRTDKFEGLDIGEWFMFVDLDGNGRYDLLAEELYSLIRVYRNVGTATEARFELVPDTLRDVDGRPIFADRQNIPSIIDLDCDGRLDLFLGRVDGTLARYEELRRDPATNLPVFELVTERFQGIEIIGQIGTLHGANAMAWADFTGNGGLDLFWGDFFEPSLLLMENTAACPSFSIRNNPVMAPTDGPPISTSGFNASSFTDLNANGRLDLLIGVLGGAFNPNLTASNNLHHYEQTEEGLLRLMTERFLSGIDVGSESTVAFADLVGTGRYDMVVGNKIDPVEGQTARLYVFRNQGSEEAPAFQLADTLSLDQVYHYAPAFADLWGDGRAHLALGTWNRGVQFYRNVSEGDEVRFESEPALTVTLTRGSHAIPALADLNGNGLLDLVVGKSSGQLSHYENVGSATEPRFALVTDEFQDIDVGRRSAPTFVDLDGNGLVDLVIGTEAGGAVRYRNVGTASEPIFELDPEWSVPLHRNSTPAFVQLHGDGRWSLFSGGLSGGVSYWGRAR